MPFIDLSHTFYSRAAWAAEMRKAAPEIPPRRRVQYVLLFPVDHNQGTIRKGVLGSLRGGGKRQNMHIRQRRNVLIFLCLDLKQTPGIQHISDDPNKKQVSGK